MKQNLTIRNKKQYIGTARLQQLILNIVAEASKDCKTAYASLTKTFGFRFETSRPIVVRV